MAMISTGSSVMRALVLVSVVTSACTDPTVDEVQPPLPGTSSNGSTTQSADGSTAPEGPGSEGLDESAEGPVLTSTDDTGSTANPYEGSYSGTWGGACPVVGGVGGSIVFAVAADGTLAGTISGTDNGPIAGTVDGAGVVDSVATSMLVGMCPFDGQIDGAGAASGPWSCAVGCAGTWSAQVN
jgi:hypothetical protein